MEYKLKLDGLDCAECGQKIQDKVNQIEGVNQCNVDFMSLSCTYSTDDNDTVFPKIKTVIHELEPEVEVSQVCEDKEYKLLFTGLDCANCAHELEESISKVEGIHSCNVDFMSVTCTYTCKESDHAQLENKIRDIVKDDEPDVVVSRKEDIPSKQYQLLFTGLDCANCAHELEESISKVEGIEACNVDFMSVTCTYTCKVNRRTELENKIKEIVKDDEPDVVVTRKEEAKKAVVDTTKEDERKEIIRILIGAAIFLLGIFLKDVNSTLSLIVFVIGYVVLGYDVVIKAVRNIIRGQLFDENFLMALATIVAFYLKDYSEAVAVMLFYQVGEAFQDHAVHSSRKSISDLMNIRPDFAMVLRGNEFVKVDPEEVMVNDIIEVKPGEKVPLDGIVTKGCSSLDTSSLTGESVQRDVEVNDNVIGGCVNINGLIEVKVTKPFGESTVSKILDLVENTSAKKAKTENFITKFSKIYTPTVVIGAVALAVILPFATGISWDESIYRACTFLVISCPCALVISIPLSFFAGIGGLSKNGVLIKGSTNVETLSKVKQVVMDKTGTLTQGKFKVESIVGDASALEAAAYAEYNSSHPIAKSVLDAYGKEIDETKIHSVKEIPGHGLEVQVGTDTILAGNIKLMKLNAIEVEETDQVGTLVYVAKNNQYLGTLVIRDQVKPDAKEALARFKALGVEKTAMVTGDAKSVAELVGKDLGVDTVYSECLPDTKVEVVDKLIKQGTLAFVGDGINDAPVLAMADVGIAMGGMGSDAAIEAADVVIMDDKISKVALAIEKAKKTMMIAKENIVGAIAIKIVILILGAFGLANMWLAIFADVGLACLCILNSIRLLRK